MAFRVISKRKTKRQAAPEASDILDLDLEGETSQASSSASGQTSTTVPATMVNPATPNLSPSYMTPQKKNVVATQPWVFRMMKSIWNWTRHFGT